jgi:hypothetical protein
MRRFIGGKPRAIATDTYLAFAKRYRIDARGVSIRRLAQRIYEHERRADVQEGLYFSCR